MLAKWRKCMLGSSTQIESNMEQLYAIRFGPIVSAIREEGWAFIFICTYLFFEYVRPQSIYTVIDVLPWVPIIIVLAVGSLLLSGRFSWQSNRLNTLMVCYALVVLLSSAFSQYPSLSFSQWRVFFDWFIIYFLIVLIVNNERRFFIFLLSFLLYSLKMSQHGFLSWAKRGFAYSDWGVTGAPGWFHNSGEVGIQMCIYVPLAVAFIIGVYKFLSRPKLLFFLLMPFTGIATVVASSSRGALVGLAATSIRPLFMKPAIAIVAAFLLSLVAVLTLLSIPEESLQRFQTAGQDRNSLHRIERWKHGLDAMNTYPVFGVGFEVWAQYYPLNYEREDKGTPLVHNVFVQSGSELGYSGLLVFVLMILACFANTRKVRQLSVGQQDRFLAIMSFGFDGALLGFLGSGFFVTVLYYPYFWIHCAMTVCLCTAARKKFSQQQCYPNHIKK
jgi:putative inorganic carbon (hco3(-)) transporter